MWRLLLVLLSTGTTAAEPQVAITVTTQPSAPTTTTPVTLSVFNSCGCPMYGTPFVVDGFVVDVPHGDACLSACLARTTSYPLGLLPAGTYTVRSFLEGEPATAVVIGEFTIAASEVASIPTLDMRGALVLALVVVLLVLRRLL